MDGNIFDGIGVFIKVSLWVMAFSVPLGIWKAVEIVAWAIHHIHVQ